MTQRNKAERDRIGHIMLTPGFHYRSQVHIHLNIHLNIHLTYICIHHIHRITHRDTHRNTNRHNLSCLRGMTALCQLVANPEPLRHTIPTSQMGWQRFGDTRGSLLGPENYQVKPYSYLVFVILKPAFLGSDLMASCNFSEKKFFPSLGFSLCLEGQGLT